MHVRIDPVQIGNDLLDYFKVNIMSINMEITADDKDKNSLSFNTSSAPMTLDICWSSVAPPLGRHDQTTFHVNVVIANH